MPDRNLLLLAPLVFAAMLTLSAPATPVPGLDVTGLVRDSSLIAVGQVTTIEEVARGQYEIAGSMRSARLMKAGLKLARVLKGAADSAVAFSYLLPDDFVGYGTLSTKDFGLFFLRPVPEGWSLTSPHYPFILAERAACATEGEPLARVVAELACSLRAPMAKTRPRWQALQALATIKTEEATIVLKQAVNELPPPLSQYAIAMLLERNEISVLPLIVEAWQHSAAAVVSEDGFSSEGNLGRSLAGVKDEAALPALAQLLESADTEVRRGVAQALRSMETKAAIEPLIKALSDIDWEVRWVAVMGLAGITGPDADGNSWYPSYDAFKQDEQRYLEHWRAWARQRSAKPQGK